MRSSPATARDAARAEPASAPDALDDLRARLTCPLCDRLFSDPATLPCRHTHCYACVTDALDHTGRAFATSACPECGAPTSMRDVQVNQTLKSFVEAFARVEDEISAVLGVVRACAVDGDGEDGTDAVMGTGDGCAAALEAGTAEAEADAEATRRACEALVEEIRAIDAAVRAIDAELVVCVEREREAGPSGVMDEDEAMPSATPRYETMSLTQLRGVYRDLYGAGAPKDRKKGWFTKHFAGLDPDVVASALTSTQAKEADGPKVVVAYSSSARRLSGQQDEKIAAVERKIKSIDPGAVFLGVKDLTSECTHLIMDTGSSDRAVKNRTAKYVEAIVRGLFIVHKDWLDDCVERGSFGNEEEYELEDVTHSEAIARGSTDGPRRARVDRASNLPGLFHGVVLRVKGCGAALSVSALEKILKLAGATIAPLIPATPRRSSRARKSIPNSDEVPDSEDEEDGTEYDASMKGDDGEEEVLTLVDETTGNNAIGEVSWRWALECICCYELLPTLQWRVAA